ncbi:hypothetical protein CSIM01_09738 [Colletotrichum simmondsii]|uniref:Heterokaryon incompatibility domain-containing protein n=1 Tax=Colletotrichum simmondsii TaxID=703756 RepID=A0A135RX11_9PEZI|nr:hypothetical protein CSIM01_09738 [Colletotrichum simmondsii]
MSRWHADWCTSPIIQVGDDQIPRCEKCQTSAHVRLRTANQPNPVLVAPKDEEYGSLNLSWPPTVTFTSDENLTHLPADKSKDDQDAQPAPCHSSDSAVVGHGTVTALSSDEFRLAVLHAVGDKGKSYPIHVDLEPYKDTHFPDYDAVSYTWGDENGNSERCHPIYVGDHWDIILQTKNCCDMLRYLRPSRGVKLIWVDAICINQNNTDERATQVAKMGQIYSRCSQVWAWMGSDLVSNELQGLPERRWLHELGTTSSCSGTFSQSRPIQNIRKLLQRRYFRRVWVIQELVLAPRVLIPIGNVIFVADHTTARKLTKSKNDSGNKSKVFWKKTEAPWFEYITQGHINAPGLWEMMTLTSKSCASDLRDRLYGILGLLSFGSNGIPLQPNYDISARQMVIGFFAHCLVNERRDHLFLAAQGHLASLDPSWLPAWKTQKSWERLFLEPPELAYDHKVTRNDNHRKANERLTKYNHWHIVRRQSDSQSREIEFRRDGRFAKTPPKARLDELKRGSRFGRYDLCQIYPWYRDFTVDSNTGSISLWLTRLASISMAPVEAVPGLLHDVPLYRIHWGPSQSFLVGSQHPLDRLLKRDDEIFALDPEKGNGFFALNQVVFMVLRKRGDGRHRLVKCFTYLCFYPTLSSSFANYRHLTELQENAHVAREKLYVQAKLDQSVYQVDERARWSLNENIYIFPMVFPGNQDTNVGHILPILTGHEGFDRLQENEVCIARGQRVTGDYLEFEFEVDFATMPGYLREGECQAENAWRAFRSWMEWEWREPGEENRLLWRRLPHLQNIENHEDIGLPSGMVRIHLRCRLEAVREVIADKAQLLGIAALWESQMFGDTPEAFEKNIRSEVTEEDFLFPNPGSGQSGKSFRPEEFAGLDGGIYRVCVA